MDIDGMVMDVSLKAYAPIVYQEIPPFIVFETFERQAIIETVYNRVNALFGRRKTFELYTYIMDFLPKFSKILTSTLLDSNHGREVEDSVFEEYFAAVPIQEKIQLRCLEFRVTRNSKFYRADVIKMEDCGKMALGILLNFKGREAYFFKAEIRDDYLMRFLKRWKYKKAFHNLRILEILYFELRNFERIQRELQFKTFPNGVNQSIIRPISRDAVYTEHGPTQFQTYIVREDGIVAYILLDETTFFFHVQEFTEEQMKAELAHS